MHAIIATYTGSPAPEQAQRLIWEASSILAGRLRVQFPRQARVLSGAWLLKLASHHNDRVAREARRACLRFGISTAVAASFTLEGDRA